MNKYVVAYLSFFDNLIKQEIVCADSELDAALTYLANHQGTSFDSVEQEDLTNLESLTDNCYDLDIAISVIKID